MGIRIDRTARADQVINAALQLYLEFPRNEVTFELLAERAGLKFWQVYRFFGNTKHLFRAAVLRLVRTLEEGLEGMPRESASVGDAARRYGGFVAEFMQRDAYAQFMYLLIRDGSVEPLLTEIYEKRIARVLQDGLARAVGDAGQKYGLIVLLSPASTREFVKSLEVELALPRLLPSFVAPPPDVVSAVIKRIVDRAVAASYALGAEAA